MTTGSRYNAAAVVGASVALFAALAFIFRGNTVPIVSDEIGYLSIAKYLVDGETITLSIMPSYRFGQALLFVPFFALGFTDEQVYQVGVLINCALTAAIPLLLLSLARRLHIERSWALVAASFMVAVFPAYTYQITLLWPETSLRFAVIALTLCAAAGWQARPVLWWAIGGAVVVWLAALHGRGLVALPGFALLLFFGVAWGKIGRIGALCIAALTVLGIVMVSFVNAQIEMRLWGHSGGEISYIVNNLTRPDGIRDSFTALVGQLWSQIVGSFGVFLLGSIAAVRLALTDRRRFPTIAFAGLLLAGSAVLSALQLGGLTRVDHLLYSRYNDAFSTVFVWIGLLTVIGRTTPLAREGLALTASVLVLGLIANYGVLPTTSGVVPPTVPALLWVGHISPILEISAFTLIVLCSLLAMAVGLFLCLQPGRYAFILLAGTLAATGLNTKRQTWSAHNARAHVANLNAPAFAGIEGPIYWDKSAAGDLNVMFDQYLTVEDGMPLADIQSEPIPQGSAAVVAKGLDVPGYRCTALLQYGAQIVVRGDGPPSC